MADTNDTIDGLLAEFRGYSAGMPASYHVTMSWADFRKMLDRFDAANKRGRGDCAEGRGTKNKDRFDNYDIAYATYHGEIVPKFGATRMEWGFGRWLWMGYIEDTMESWKEMHRLGILTRVGDTALARATKKAEKEGPR